MFLDYFIPSKTKKSSSSSKSVGTMPVVVHCTMRKYSRINWGYYLWNADLVVLVAVDRAEPVCVHLTQRQVSGPTPVTQVGTRTMFLYFVVLHNGFLLGPPQSSLIVIIVET